MEQEEQTQDVVPWEPDVDSELEPKELADKYSITKDQAREFLSAVVRDKELDAEAVSVSGDEHLTKILNNPLKEIIEVIEEDNKKLVEAMRKPAKMFGADGELSPTEARDMLRENAKLLLEMKAKVTPKAPPEGVGINIDIGGVFNDALLAAREATEKEVKVLPKDVKVVE